MWQQIVVGVLVLGAVAYVVKALWPKQARGGACCNAGSAAPKQGGASTSNDGGK